MRLAGEDDLDGTLLVAQHALESVELGEQQPGPLVRREPTGEADRQDRRIERRLELREDRRRLAVAGELAAQPAPREVGQLALLAQVRLPQLLAGDALDPFPEATLAGARVQVVEVGVEVAGEEVRDGLPRSRSGRGRRW